MDLDLENIEDYTRDLGWMLKALEQLEREFRGEMWTFEKPEEARYAFTTIIFQLEPRLKDLIARRGDAYFQQLLYKIDVSEDQIVKAISSELDAEFSKVVSILILKRCLQKVLMRNCHKLYEKDTPDKALEQ